MMISIHFGWLILTRDLIEIFNAGTDAMKGAAVFAHLSLLKDRFVMFGIPACFLMMRQWLF